MSRQNDESYYDCDICGFTFKKKDLIRHKGLLVDKACLDEADIDSKYPWGFYGKQDAGAETVTSITAAGGITRTKSYMLIQGDSAAVNITADPQIAAGTDEDLLTLEGNSDTYTVTLEDGTGLSLREDKAITLKQGTVISFVYSSDDSLWVETSRSNFYTDEVQGRYI